MTARQRDGDRVWRGSERHAERLMANAERTADRVLRAAAAKADEMLRPPTVRQPGVDLVGFPPVLRQGHMARIFGQSVRTIQRQVQAGRFPIPRLARMPTLAWSKATVLAFFAGETFAPPAVRRRGRGHP